MLWLVLLLCWQALDPQAEGLKALDAQKFDEAVQWFQKAVAANAKDVGARFNLALAYSLQGKAAAAIPEYKTVLELKPGLYEAQLNLGILLIGEMRGAEAVVLLESACAQKPVLFRPRYYFGEALLAAGDARAADAFRAAIGADAKSAPAEFGLAQALVRESKIADAVPHFRRAAELDPAYEDSLLTVGSQFEKAGKRADAIAVYEQFKKNPAVAGRLGVLLFDTGRAAEAIPYLISAPPTPATRLALAQAYLATQQPEKGFPLLRQAVAAEPRDYALRMFYGRTLRDRRNFVPASQQFFAAAQLKGDSVEAWSELSGVLMLTDQYPEALNALDRIRALHAETTPHFYFRAIVLDKLRQVKPAIESYKKYLANSTGKNPDEDFKARQRLRILEQELHKK